MNQAISKTVRVSAIAATLLFGTAAAHAQGAYTGDTGHYLQAPQGYQAQASASSSFNGQGMGRGQLMQQPSQLPAVQPQAMATTTVSPRMLPQGSTQAAPAAPLTVVTMTQPLAAPTAYKTASTVPSTAPSAQALAAIEPAAGDSSSDNGTNVLLSPNCGSPSNHRQHKGINTSTVVGDNCFN